MKLVAVIAAVSSACGGTGLVAATSTPPPDDIGDGCRPIPNVDAEPGDPALMRGYSLVSAAKKDNAVCLDGSPGLYYHRPGTGTGTSKWYIHQEGGGWCSSIAACQGRSQTNLGSSKNYTATVSMNAGYFSLEPAVNPLMHNWNMVYFKYCDGGSFSGSNASSTPPDSAGGTRLHWRGKHILNGGITDMLRHRGLAKATEVVVSGCSAGGLAAFLHCDHLADRIHKEGLPSAKVVCMPDSGLFRDYQGCVEQGLCRAPHYHDRLTWVFTFMNATSGVNDACVASENPVSNCIFAEHTMKYIRTPTFPLQSEYDAWQVIADLGVLEMNNTMPIDPAKVQLVNEYGRNFTAIVKRNLLSQPQHGIFLDSCFHHCGGWGSYRAGPQNVTQPMAMKEWYDAIGSETHDQKAWIQGRPYPCLECCGQ
eukprot:SAG31_NODE_429_length_15801_cov_6.878551_3_plen_422_part_00